MALQNSEVVRAFNEYADFLEIEGASPFRIRAYRNAAHSIEACPAPLADLIERESDLTQLPGIGKDLASKITRIVRTGRFDELEDLRSRFGPEISQLLGISGLGARRVRELHEKLGVATLADLERAVREGSLKQLKGFGEKIEQQITAGLKARGGPKLLLALAKRLAEPLIEHLQAQHAVLAAAAGSYRRNKELVGDLDVLAASTAPAETLMERFLSYPARARVLAHGATRSAMVLQQGLQVDLRVVPLESYGAALHYFTGSKAHNVRVRQLGIRRGLKVNEYGVFKDDERIAGADEAEVYASLGLPFIEPELREDEGEIEAAHEGRLPALITAGDVRGDLHCHSNYSDGRAGMREMAAAARALGYEYLAITDHSKSLKLAHGLDARRLLQQIREIDDLNSKLRGITILKGVEVDILEDGSLDLPDSVLAELDLTVCSIHSRFRLPRAAQTERVIRAMDNRHFRILGHPTGRLLNKRPPYEIDLEAVIAAAAERGRFIEINSNPQRLDLPARYARHAKSRGVRLAVSTDAHTPRELEHMEFGLGQARRGWLETGDVINTLPLAELLELLKA